MIPPSQPATSSAAEARRGEHDQAGGDLHDADEVHRGGGAAGDQVVELRRQVAGPVVREDAGELVEAEDDRREREHDPQQQVRLRGGVGGEGGALREGAGGDGGVHARFARAGRRVLPR